MHRKQGREPAFHFDSETRKVSDFHDAFRGERERRFEIRAKEETVDTGDGNSRLTGSIPRGPFDHDKFGCTRLIKRDRIRPESRRPTETASSNGRTIRIAKGLSMNVKQN